MHIMGAMQTIAQRIDKIEDEATKAEIPISRICNSAKINNSTYQRWKTGITQPTLAAWERFTAAFEKEIAK